MLKRDWPGSFRRTITSKVKGKEVRKTLEFSPGVPVDLTPSEVEALRSDIGAALHPTELDDKARPRIITDEVSVDETVIADEPQSTN